MRKVRDGLSKAEESGDGVRIREMGIFMDI